MSGKAGIDQRRSAEIGASSRVPGATSKSPKAQPNTADFANQLKEFLRLSKRHDLSPLRYPGGKRRLVRAFLPIVANLRKPVELFVEPFAGGAAMSIAMLESGLAKKIALSDRDPLIGSFWSVVFSEDAQQLADLVRNADVTLEAWRRTRKGAPRSNLKRAYACLFLSRTSFSGILAPSAGPIGGISQSSEYSIDCRFNREALAARIEKLSTYRSRVLFARTTTYRTTISAILRSAYSSAPGEVLWYFDPPFFEKADKLYRYFFDASEHRRMHQDLKRLAAFKWILSYDDVQQSRNLYGDAPGFYVTTPTYLTAEKGMRRRASELIVTNVCRVALMPQLGSEPKRNAAYRETLKLKAVRSTAASQRK